MIAQLLSLPSETKIQKHLRQILYGKNLCCPRCRFRHVRRSEGRYRCPRCRRPFSLLTGTWLEGTKLSLRTVWAMLWCWTQQIPVRQTQALCHLSEETVRHWYATFRAHLPQEDPILSGVIQMDEASFRALALLMAKQVGSRKLVFRLLLSTPDKEAASRFLWEAVAPKSRVQTDGSRIYGGMERRWPVSHRTDIHAKWEFGKTSEIEGVFGNLRTFLRRMYHHVTLPHLPGHVQEFVARFSHAEWFHSPHAYLEIALTPVPLA